MRNWGIIIAASLVLASCGGNGAGSLSSANPFSWFNRGDRGVTPDIPVQLKDPRALVPSVAALRAEPTTGGLLVIATAEVPSAGYFEFDLVPVNNGFTTDEGALAYELRAFLPNPAPAVRNTERVDVAVYIAAERLRGVSAIEVQAANNTRSLRP